jgi:hypothetical protein
VIYLSTPSSAEYIALQAAYVLHWSLVNKRKGGQKLMDFRQTLQPSNRPGSAPAGNTVSVSESARKAKSRNSDRWLRVLNAVILVSIAILVAAIALSFTHNNGGNEFKLVNDQKYQAVFLNNGQVYFGHISSMDGKNLVLNGIYYLTQNTKTGSDGQATADGNYTLVKLGCQQIHDPYDQMVINRDQITFWENLQDNGKVVSSINDFKKQNPKGPDCSQVSNQTQASSNAGAQGNVSGNKQ